jgi:hypothetical protein
MVSVYLLLIISNPTPPSTSYTLYHFCPPLSPSTISRLCPSLVSHSGFGNDMTQRAWARHSRVPDRMAGLLSLHGVRVSWGGRGEWARPLWHIVWCWYLEGECWRGVRNARIIGRLLSEYIDFRIMNEWKLNKELYEHSACSGQNACAQWAAYGSIGASERTWVPRSGWGRLPASSAQLMAYGGDALSSHLILPPSISILPIAFLAPQFFSHGYSHGYGYLAGQNCCIRTCTCGCTCAKPTGIPIPVQYTPLSSTATIYVVPAVAVSVISVSSISASNRSLHPVNSVRTWSYYLLAPFPQSVTGSRMQTDWVGDIRGKRGNWKESRPSRDLRRLNSDKWMEWQDQLHIGIQEKNTSMKDMKYDGSTDLALHVCQTDTHSPCSLCLQCSLFPFSLFSYAHPLILFVNTQREWSHRVLIP